MSTTTAPALRCSISDVERDLGVAKETLRVWERRYGFPQPQRDANGERVYPADQVHRLTLVKRLLDQGYRPGGAGVEMARRHCTPGTVLNLGDIAAAVARWRGQHGELAA
jgi:hypothetical protein